jgi:hypothetical protein
MNHSAIVPACDVCGSGVVFLGDSKVSLCRHKIRISDAPNSTRELELIAYELQFQLKATSASIDALTSLAKRLLRDKENVLSDPSHAELHKFNGWDAGAAIIEFIRDRRSADGGGAGDVEIAGAKKGPADKG